MNPDDIDKEIIKIIEINPGMPYSRIAELLQISEEEVKEKLEMLSDTRQLILIVDDELDTLIPLKRAGMDGFEVCKVLKDDTLTDHIPIIMLTAKGEIDDKIEGMETGADDYVTKPFDLGELKARIKMILRRTNI